LNQPNKLTPVIIASIIIIVISSFPGLNLLNLFCCAGVLLGGFAGTSFYNTKLKNIDQKVSFKDAAAIGLLSGILSAIIVVIITTALSLLINQNPIPEMFKMIDSQGVQLPPDLDRFLQKISDEYSKHGFSFTLTIITLAMDLIIYPIFSILGGIIAVAVASRKKNVLQ
jgi:hypothetical protein